MFTSRSRVRGRQGSRRRWWNPLQVLGLEGRIAPAQFVVTSSADDGSVGTLRSMIANANYNGEADTITFGPAVTSITLATGQLTISESINLTIDGGGTVTINGAATPSATNRLLNLTASGQPTIEIKGLTLAKGNLSSGIGAAISITNQIVLMTDVTFSQNATAASGGAIGVQTSGAKITLTKCDFLNNVAGADGGGYYSTSSTTLVLSLCNFVGNIARGTGGGLRFGSGTVNLNGCKVTTNILDSKGSSSSGYGAGCYLYGASQVVINNSIIENNHGNHATLNGIGIYASGSTVTLNGCVIQGNSTETSVANSYGGGIFAYKGALTVSGCTISDNSVQVSSRAYGAGIYTSSTAAVISKTTVSRNTNYAGNWAYGGGVYCTGGTVSVVNCTIAENAITYGTWTYGAAFYGDSAAVSIANSTIAKNRIVQGNSTASAGIYVSNCITDIDDSIVTQNSIGNANSPGGGGLYINGSSAQTTIDSSIITANTSSTGDMAGSPSQQIVYGNDNIFGTIHNSISVVGYFNENSALPAGLYPLANYGGPTQTMGLHYTSLALNRGQNSLLLTTDQRGLPREVPTGAPDVGAVEGFEVFPFVDSVSTIANVKSAGGTDLSFTVTYDSPIGIDTSTIDGNDVVVTGRVPMQQIVVTGIATVGNRVTATYKIIAPGGTWDSKDVGTFAVGLAANQVFDLSGLPNTIVAQELGSFFVSIAGKFIVDSKLDVVDNDYSAGQFTLREALDIANADVSTTDTISFDTITFGTQSTINVGSELPVSSSVVINGPGVGLLTLSGGGTTRIMNITSSFNSTINNLTFGNGQAAGNGGAILANQSLVLSSCAFVNNVATGNGGAISTLRQLTMTGCYLSNNAAGGAGGAIEYQSSSAVNLSLTTLAGNTAVSNGGAVWLNNGYVTISRCGIFDNHGANGGALYLASSYPNVAPVVENCTISGNSAVNFGGGIFQGNLSITWIFRNSTLTGNLAGLAGGGIFRGSNTGSINLASVIVSGNQAISGPDLFFDVPTVVPATNSLVGIADQGSFSLSGTGNLAGTKSSPLDAKLGPLANNGGPTLTHALLIGSPAVNTGNNASKLTVDQRGTGFARVVGGQADIGAFEVQTPPPRATAFQVNDGSGQRSRVTSFRVTFSEAVVFPNGASAAFELLRTGPDTPIGAIPCIAVPNGNEVTITFSNGGAIALDPGGSLPDGKYQLSIAAAQVVGVGGLLDGNGDGIPGGNQATSFHRLFGDSNGDRKVTSIDYNAFRIAWATNNTTFDFNNDGIITAADFSQFRLRYGIVI